MAIATTNTLALVAIALASAGVVFLVLHRIGNFRFAAGAAVAMFLLRFAMVWFLDLEPLGELSTFRDTGAALPAWLAGLGYFNQFGMWGAFLAFAVLRRREAALVGGSADPAATHPPERGS